MLATLHTNNDAGALIRLVDMGVGPFLLSSTVLASLAQRLVRRLYIDSHGAAFDRPTKPIGPFYDAAAKDRLAAERGWTFVADGTSWRRTVASPRPVEIQDVAVIAMLVEHGIIVICAGGGGIPVVRQPDGRLAGVEAVIDKDRASGLLAEALDADMLMLLTDVDAVYQDYGTPNARAVERAGASAFDLAAFPAGSMGPKLDAALTFAAGSGRAAAIGRLEDASELLKGMKGTIITGQASGLTLRDMPARLNDGDGGLHGSRLESAMEAAKRSAST